MSENKKNNRFYGNNSFNKYNLSSYFQLKDEDKILDNKSNINSNQTTYYNNFSKPYKYFKKINYNINNRIACRNNNSIPLTPNSFYRENITENNIDNSTYSNIKTESVDNNNNKNRKKFEVIKTLSSNKNNFMTQTRFYRSKLNPDELLSNYAKEKIKSINSSRNNSYKSFIYRNNYLDNINQDENRKITHSVSNLNSILYNNRSYNPNMINYINNNTEFNNKIFDNNIYNYNYKNNVIKNNFNYYNSKIKKLNTYKTTCSLKKGKSYSYLQNLFKNNHNRNDNKLLNFLKNYKYDNIKNNLSEQRNYRFSSSFMNGNKNYNNLSLYGFNMNNNSLNYSSNGYLCNQCLKRRLFINNQNNINDFNNQGEYNNIKFHIIKC